MPHGADTQQRRCSGVPFPLNAQPTSDLCQTINLDPKLHAGIAVADVSLTAGAARCARRSPLFRTMEVMRACAYSWYTAVLPCRVGRTWGGHGAEATALQAGSRAWAGNPRLAILGDCLVGWRLPHDAAAALCQH